MEPESGGVNQQLLAEREAILKQLALLGSGLYLEKKDRENSIFQVLKTKVMVKKKKQKRKKNNCCYGL